MTALASPPRLGGALLCELFHDLSRDEWFVERVYD